MKQGYRFVTMPCQVCGKNIPYNWLIRHAKERHGLKIERAASSDEQAEFYAAIGKAAWEAYMEHGVVGLRSYSVTLTKAGAPAAASVMLAMAEAKEAWEEAEHGTVSQT